MEQLQQWIEDGTLQPRELVKDTEIASKLGVSRTPVREAFQRLEQLGLLVTTSNTRTQVAPARPQDAALLYSPLAALHEVAVDLAITGLGAADFEEMNRINEELLVALRRDDADAANRSDEAFHSIVLDRTANPFLLHVTEWLTVHARRLSTLYFTQPAPSEESYDEHVAIIEALRCGDAGRAKTLIRHNVLRTVQVLGAAHPPAGD
jgi:DNA-binding GntR family transcriptional regulator